MDSRGLSEGVRDPHAVVRDAEVLAVDAAAGPVVPARAFPVLVVQHLSGKAGEHRALHCPEEERGDGGAVLPEINNEGLALRKRAIGREPAPVANGNVAKPADATVHLPARVCAVYALPDVRRDGLKRLVEAAAYLPAVGRKYLALELFVALGLPERLSAEIRRHDARIVFFAVEDRGVLDGAAYARLPVVGVGAVVLD